MASCDVSDKGLHRVHIPLFGERELIVYTDDAGVIWFKLSSLLRYMGSRYSSFHFHRYYKNQFKVHRFSTLSDTNSVIDLRKFGITSQTYFVAITEMQKMLFVIPKSMVGFEKISRLPSSDFTNWFIANSQSIK